MPTVDEINGNLHRKLHSGSEYDKYMPHSDCSSVSLGKGTTDFGIKSMAKWAKKYQHHTKKLAPILKRSSLIETCRNIKDFSYWHLQYKLDGQTQNLRSPACSWATRKHGIDCKSYSIFISSILLNLNIPHYMRRIKQQGSYPDAFTHVYIVVPKDGKNLKNGYYTIDGTVKSHTEVPFLAADDVFVGDAIGLGAYTPFKISNQAESWTTAMQVIRRFQLTYPENADLHYLKKDLIALRKSKKPVRLKINGFSVILNGKKYNLIPPQQSLNAPNYVNSEIAPMFTEQQAQKVMAEVQLRSNLIKTQAVGVVQAVGQTGISIATSVSYAFPPAAPIAMIVAAAIEVVTLLVSLWVAFGYDPCSGAEYDAFTIGNRLQEEFVPSFSRCVKSIETGYSTGSSGFGIALNELLKEIDLGVAHYNHEKKTHNGNACSKQALYSYQEFVQNIKTTVDNLYIAVKSMLKGRLKIVETEQNAGTNNRSWFFIVPNIKNPIQATYRKIRISKWNENLREVYPFAVDFSYQNWAITNKNYLNTIYVDSRGNQYYNEIKSFGIEIKEIRDNLYMSSSFRYEKEKLIRKKMLAVYLKYDTDYAKSLEKSFIEEAQAYNKRQIDFLDELEHIVKIKVNEIREKRENVKIIAESNKQISLKRQEKQLVGTAVIGLLALTVIKSLD